MVVVGVVHRRFGRRVSLNLRSRFGLIVGSLLFTSTAALGLAPGVASASLTTSTTAGTTLYVTPSGSGTACSVTDPCSLTQAITLANSASGDTVMVSAGTYDTGANSKSTNLTTGTIAITASMTIVGAGADKTFIGGTSMSDQVAGSVFQIGPAPLAPDVTLIAVSVQYGDPTYHAGLGGGVYNDSYGTVNLADDAIVNNAAFGGGGIANAATGSIDLANDTVANNEAYGGGGVFNLGNLLAIDNTIADNQAYSGGGIADAASTSDTLAIEDTVASNTATESAGGIYSSSGSIAVAGSIVAENSGGDCGGSITDAGYNLESGTSCGFSATNRSLQSTNPLLGPLANNGGPTQTIAITASSPAYDVIPSSSLLCSGGTDTSLSPPITIPHTDQRGVLRLPSGATGCDIGAYQVGSISLTPQTLPPAHLNKSYSATFTTTNTYQPVYSIISGALPTGLTLDATTGTISGTPQKVGNSSFTLSIQSGKVLGALTQSYTISVTNPTLPHITSINPTHIPQYTSSFITISGRDLTKAGATCYGALEMAHCGVSVTIGGLPATVAYASPTTLDVITPKVGVGILLVVVHVGAESSNAVPLQITSLY